MVYPKIPSAQTLIQYCKSREIDTVIISPGSRNAPLTIGFTGDPYFRCYSIVDERSAGFFGLGIAQNTQKPVVLVCTSGSAVLNYYPAIAEAFYSKLPLLVVSADRPDYKIDRGDGQTIRQDHVLDKHVAFSVNLKLDTTHATETIRQFDSKKLDTPQKEIQKYNEDRIAQALDTCLNWNAPVHINIPFEEPLYEKLATPYELLIKPREITKEAAEPISENSISTWNSCTKKMILVGVCQPKTIAAAILERLAKDPSIVVLTETTSNLHHPNFFPSIDSILAPIEKSAARNTVFENLKPTILLTFGGLIVSKKVKAFLRDFPPETHWHVDPIDAQDTFFLGSTHIKENPNTFLKQLLQQEAHSNSEYHKAWNRFKQRYRTGREKYLKQIPFSDFSAFTYVLQSIPKKYQVQLSNSSAVRYAQLFDMDASQTVFCNRGTSGIDGSTSTAVGASVHCKEPTLLISGDLSFFYDSNGLWNSYLKNDFRIVVINNGGGGIFRILPGKEDSEVFSTFFETSHNLDSKSLSEHFGLDYVAARNNTELKKELKIFYNTSTKPRLLEVFTPRMKNNQILLDYFDFIS